MDEKKSQNAIREEEILKFWKENDIFNKSLNKKSTKGDFVFYEGPPTANGKPGIHHLESRAFKDAIPRYKTMRGYNVPRKGGWDTHGLPVELQVEKKLGLESKKAIEDYGIGKFNEECKESVWEFLEYWNRFTSRIGYWVDQENPYITYENNYIESLWNILSKVENKNLLYKDYKVVPWCPRCGTGLSSHELAQGYQDVKDLSVTAKFRVRFKDTTQETHPHFNASTLTRSDLFPATYLLAWTTTPWTLPGNVGLAVGEDIDYVKIHLNNEYLILAKALLKIVEGEYDVADEFKGKDLVGLEYEPLYDSFKELAKKSNIENLENAYKVYLADFVTTEDGTGIVHTAVMYGQDDFELGTKVGLPKFHTVDESGHFVKGTGFLEDKFVKDEETAVDIIKDLAHRGLLFKKEKYEHNYPHCWRCKTALIYYARDSWYIRMSSLKQDLVDENKNINWEPSHIRDGRFGEWLKDVKDWAISRERYWGTPLPVWECASCDKRHVVNSFFDLKNKTKKSGNKYFVMRHGEAESNVRKFNAGLKSKSDLTENGKAQVLGSIDKIKNLNIDLIVSSPIARTKQTAELIAQSLGIEKNKIIFENDLREIDFGKYEGTPHKSYHDFFKGKTDVLKEKPEGGESQLDLRVRMGDFIYNFDKKYTNKNVLFLSHGDPIRSLFLASGGSLATTYEQQEIDFVNYPKNAEIKELDFIPLPHNKNYELDFHRPYIDDIKLECECDSEMQRVKEVMDVWFDSGAMPYAQDHYPFENKNLKYPADYISEAVDQTRGWFYTLHAVGVLLGKGKAYKNVICLGHILDEKGKKMSKSLGNIVDPWIMMDKYGVDTLRLWMYSVNQPGDSKNFDEKTVAELKNKVFNLFYNVLSFYDLYRDKDLESLKHKNSSNILDKWILARLDELVVLTTNSLDNFKLFEPVRAFREFIDDLSTWYLRRSRDRLKDGDREAKQTLYFVLKTFSKLLAPFAPFSAEDIWQKLKTDKDEESVHLSEWPKSVKSIKQKVIKGIQKIFGNKENKILEEMVDVRSIVNMALKERQQAGIAVRQPLNELQVKSVKLKDEYIEILKDELNVKNIVFTNECEEKVILDFTITPELKKEGQYREIVRAVQDMRKKIGLVPSDTVDLVLSKEAQGLVEKFSKEFKETVGAQEVVFKDNTGEEIKIDELVLCIEVKKR